MNGVSTIELVARMTGSLLVIGGLLWVVQRVGKNRLGGLGRSASSPLQVTSRKQLGRTSSVALVQAGQRNILIGITETSISLLAEGDDLVADLVGEGDSPTTSPAWSRMRLLGRHTPSPPDELELAPELHAINRSWTQFSSNGTARARQEEIQQEEVTSAARKPRRRTSGTANSASRPNHSGMSALDALRDMTVRKG